MPSVLLALGLRSALRSGSALVVAVALSAACGRAPSAAAPAPPRPAVLRAELAFATYWGSRGGSALRSIVFDPAGNIYVVGGTENPAEWPQTGPAAGSLGFFDVIAAKFAPDGRNLWSRVIGGTGEDYAYVAALDRDGNLIVGGRSGPEFPVTPGAYDVSFGGGRGKGPHGATDGFVLSLAPADGALRWATYIGGNGDEITRGIELLPDGAIAVSGGNMSASDLPVTPGVLKPKLGGAKDVYLALLEPDGSGARFLTYLGPSDDRGTGDEELRAIGWDPRGLLWLAGTTSGTDMVATPGAFQPRRDAGASAFVAKVTPDGRRMPYLSWLGGSGDENLETEGVSDAEGAFYFTGSSSSPDFPATPGAEVTGGVERDGIVVRVDPDGRLGMAAQLGGSGGENFFGPALGAGGLVFVGGASASPDFPLTHGAVQPAHGGRGDALLVAFERNGKLAYATFFGGSGEDSGRFVAVDATRTRVAIAGETSSPDLPVKKAAQTKPGATFLAVYDVAPLAGSSAEASAPAPAAP